MWLPANNAASPTLCVNGIGRKTSVRWSEGSYGGIKSGSHREALGTGVRSERGPSPERATTGATRREWQFGRHASRQQRVTRSRYHSRPAPQSASCSYGGLVI